MGDGLCSGTCPAFLLDNGHLLRPGSIGGDAQVFGPGPAVGGRIQEFTWDGELVWDFKFYNAKQLPHHDMTRLPNGNVLLIVWDRKTTEEAIAAGRRPEMTGDRHLLPDSLVEIKPTGKTTGEVVWEWHLWDHLVQDFDKSKANFGNVAEHPELVNINYGEDELPSVIAAKDGKDKPKADGKPAANRPPRIDPDYTHFNGVAYNPDLDQIAVSVWAFSEFWIIDHGTTTAAGGRPHRRPQGQRRRSSLPLGQPAGLSGRDEGGPEALLPAQCALDSQGSSRRGTSAARSITAASGRMGVIRRWTSWCSPPIRRGDTLASRARPTGRTNPCGATPRPRSRIFIRPSFPAPSGCRTATRSSARAPTAPSSK